MNKKLYGIAMIALCLVFVLSACGGAPVAAQQPAIKLTLAYRVDLSNCPSLAEQIHFGPEQFLGTTTSTAYTVYTNTAPVVSTNGGILTLQLSNYYYTNSYPDEGQVSGPNSDKTFTLLVTGGVATSVCSLSYDTKPVNYQVEVTGH
ncbi:MAG: hypothetical protein ABSE04_02310 [Candidatus Microgenomates bacterium]|jgi:hypothetical protein